MKLLPVIYYCKTKIRAAKTGQQRQYAREVMQYMKRYERTGCIVVRLPKPEMLWEGGG